MSARRKLRVLSIAHPAVKTSIGRLRYRWLAGLDDLDVHLLVPDRWTENGKTMHADTDGAAGYTLHIEQVRLTYLPKINWYAHFYPGLWRLIARLNPDVIHLWEEPWSAVALQACCRKGKAALVLEVDQNILRRLPQPFEAVRRFVLRRTDHILSRGDDATAVVEKCGYRGGVTTIGYGVDTEVFKTVDVPMYPQPRETLKLGYCGRLVVDKGIDDALDAMRTANAPIELSIMGDGVHGAALRAKAQSLGLQNRVAFVDWSNPEGVAGFFRSLDASLLLSRTMPTWREQFGRTIIESQSCGAPVIGSTSGAIPDVIGAGGWTVPESDPAALSKLFERLWAQPLECHEKRAAGIANVNTRFTFEIIAQSLAQAWREAAISGQRRNRQGIAVSDPAAAT
jgi:glycosyltransferase involved in cell wall biosynthesis